MTSPSLAALPSSRRALAALALLLAALGCRDVQNAGKVTPRPDAGPPPTRTCTQTADCGGTGICLAGLCQEVTSCTVDADCAGSGKVCHAQRFYCVECDGRSGQCGAGEACQFDFTCVPISSGVDAGVGDGGSCSGSCSDRNQCGADQVCRGGQCCAPPSRCRSPADCPASAPECNGATGQCFGGEGCFGDEECATRPGCGAGACVCQIQGAPPGVCRVRPDECQSDADCRENGVYVGKFCTLTSPPKRCLNAPGCASDADCLADGLVCDTAAGSPSRNKCVNGTPCPVGNECGQGQVCASGVCVAQNCLNTPSLCGQGEACDPASLRCVPQQGGPCSSNSDCGAGTYCNGINCAPGCRDNADCGGGVCNAQHQCEQPSGGICGPCASDADCPGGSRCIANPITGAQLCQERCSSLLGIACTANPMATCLLGNCSCIF